MNDEGGPTSRQRHRGSAKERQAQRRRRGAEDEDSPRWENAIERLKAAGLKGSQVRSAVIEVFFGVGGKITAEQLTARVRERTPGVSLPTVYRTLRVLVEHGLASASQLGREQTRFEPVARGPTVDRLVCVRCRAVVELVEHGIEELQSAAARRQGFELLSRKSEVRGVCPRCRRARDASPGADEGR